VDGEIVGWFKSYSFLTFVHVYKAGNKIN